jgi:hypothetical protein
MKIKTQSMKLVNAAILLCGSVALAAHAQEPKAISGPSPAGSLTRWHAPAFDVTKDNQVPIVPLGQLTGSVQATIDPKPVLLYDLQGVVLSVLNNTNRPIVVDTDKAVAIVGGAAIPGASTGQIAKAACPEAAQPAAAKRGVRNVVLAAVTIGAVQLIRDARMQKGPILQRYGCDEARRQDEVETFGSKVVWPGTTGKGIVYFSTPATLHGATLTVPVRALYEPTDQVSISIPL